MATINFKHIEDSTTLQDVLEYYLPPGQVNIGEVTPFLTEHGFECGELEYVNEDYARSSMESGFSGAAYDSVLPCRLETKRPWRPQGFLPWVWVQSWLEHRSEAWAYIIHFHFADTVLVDILIIASGDGL